MKIYFFGGSQEVTGSNYLLESKSGSKTTKVLIDCGLFQGSKVGEEKNNDPFPYKPSEIDGVIVTHAHLDHIGRIPKLVKDGFKGKIFSTAPTKDFAKLMLIDSIGVLSKEAKKNGRGGPIYEEADVAKSMLLWEAVNYHQDTALENLNITLKDAGHILGSAFVEIKENKGQSKKLVFSGDLGNSPEPLLNPTETVSDASFMVVESTYGDRLHGDSSELDIKVERMIEDTVKNGGVLMIPAFSLERTQRILYQINNLVENGRIPRIKIFLDSPLSIQATAVYKKYLNYYNDEARNTVLKGDDLFNFPGLEQTMLTEDSKKIFDIPAPKVIIAGAGMCNGGRILHHLKNYLGSSKNTLMLVSYQAPGSLGRIIQDGARVVTLMGEKVAVEAKIDKMNGYSSHADLNGLLHFVNQSADTLEKVFISHGELKASLFLTQRIRDYIGVDALPPKYGDSYEIAL